MFESQSNHADKLIHNCQIKIFKVFFNNFSQQTIQKKSNRKFLFC
jgi:hypothetical protein